MVDSYADPSMTTDAELQALFAAVDDLVLIRDAQGYCHKILTPNSRLLYRPAEAMIGYRLHDNLPHPIADRLLEGIRAALARRQTVNLEFALEIGDRQVWLDSRLSPIDHHRVLAVVRDVTDRKQLQENLAQSQAQLQRIVDQANVVIVSFLLYPATFHVEYLYYSAGCEQIYGFTAAELLTHASLWRSRVHADDWEQVIVPALAQLLQETRATGEYRFLHRNQTWRWIAETSTATWDEGHQCWVVTTVASDISDRKAIEQQLQNVLSRNITNLHATEEALRQSEEQFRTLFEAAPLPMSLADVQTHRLIRVNVAYQQWLGYTPDELSTKTYLDLTHPDDVATEQHFSDVLMQQQSHHVQLRKRFIKKSGEIVWADIQVVLIRDDQGQPRYSLCVSQDVTQAVQLVAAREQAEAALRQQAERDQLLRSMTQHIHQSLDLEEILAIAVTEVRQTLAADRVLIFELRPDGSGRVRQESVVAGYPNTQTGIWHEIAISQECYHYYSEGIPRIVQDIAADPCTLRPVDYLASVGVQSKLIAPIIHIPEQGDTSLWGLLIVHACTPCRQWQADEADLLQQMANQLAIAIQQATLYHQAQLELAERQQAEAHLRILLQEKDVLLKEVHHRVKNNLQVISSLLRMQSRLVDEPIAELFQEAQNRVQSIAIVHEHLYQSVDLSKINFKEYVQILVNNLLRSYGVNPNHIQVQLEIQAVNLELSLAIPCGLIINELVSNALKYAFSKSKSGEIKISLASQPRNHSPGDNQGILIVQDDGSGIPATVDWQTSRTLGLRIVRTLVEQLSGTITLQRDRGTGFQITFPMSAALS